LALERQAAIQELRAEHDSAEENLPVGERRVTIKFLDSCIREAQEHTASSGFCYSCGRPLATPGNGIGEKNGEGSGDQSN